MRTLALLLSLLLPLSLLAQDVPTRYAKAKVQDVVSDADRYQGKTIAVYGQMISAVAESNVVTSAGCDEDPSRERASISIEILPDKADYSDQELSAGLKKFEYLHEFDKKCVWVVGEFYKGGENKGASIGVLRKVEFIYK